MDNQHAGATENLTAQNTPGPGIGLLKNPLFFRISYAIIALMFLLPFTEISCNGITMAKASGADLALGFEMKPGKTIENWTDEFDRNDRSDFNFNSSGRKDPNSFALAAMIFAIAGTGFSFIKNRQRLLLIFIVSVLGTAALIALMVDLKADIKNETAAGAFDSGIRVTLDFTAWFYLVLIFFISLALISWRQWKDARPPVGDPATTPQQ